MSPWPEPRWAFDTHEPIPDTERGWWHDNPLPNVRAGGDSLPPSSRPRARLQPTELQKWQKAGYDWLDDAKDALTRDEYGVLLDILTVRLAAELRNLGDAA